VSLVGTVLELDVGAPAHGGSCVARHDGRVVFVRHALPGERVRARVTEESKHFARADAIEVMQASEHRVVPRCDVAVPGGCGGCDWQHASGPFQRQIKAGVVAEQLKRLAGIDREVVVEELPGDGFGWRTRVRFAVDTSGRAGFRRHRSHHVVATPRCVIAHPQVEAAEVEARQWEHVTEVEVAASVGTGERLVRVASEHDGPMRMYETTTTDGRTPTQPPSGRPALYEQAIGRRWRVSAGGFWQVHPSAAEVLTEAVLGGLHPQAGEHALDLYAGVGLFAGALAMAVGPSGAVTAIESSAGAAADAVVNLADLAQARVLRGDVAHLLATPGRFGPIDVVVLDPPRSGAGAAVVQRIAALGARAVAYVACDPAALARDLATFAAGGFALSELRAFDLFPQTHHVECVAIVRPVPAVDREAAS
jgi:tRNA/tmRNA/rRNA uracil-C5-methylase (TrmA/RlmC/RlmD family)